MKGTKLFKNARLKGQKELVSILIEDVNVDLHTEESPVVHLNPLPHIR